MAGSGRMDDNAVARLMENFGRHLPVSRQVWDGLEQLPGSDQPLLELARMQVQVTSALVMLEFQMAVDRGDLSDQEKVELAADDGIDLRFPDMPDDPRDLT